MSEPLAPALRDAYAHCARVLRESGSSFAAAFWMLPAPQRRALHAVYAFCRLADDVADDPAVRGDRQRLLERWRAELAAAYRGDATHPVGIALGDAVRRFRLPQEVFADLLCGVESDLRGEPIATWADLERYCYRVASTVGLLLVRILGARNPDSLEYARQMGIAVQLTNVLRDVGEDAAAGRIYLAREDLERLHVPPESLRAGKLDEETRLLLALYAERARIRYEAAARLLPAEDRRALRPAQAMGGIYRALLDELHARGFPCLGPPLRLSKPRRLAIAARAWLGIGARA
ncbi:MAG: presqualene diphosphate synthase HpnD [Deltaproteobacteria bacterium]|nr:presqualene diphosphate synthase HpnD [Deltaproteobacteria bacterium]